MGGACGTYGGDARHVQGLVENPEGTRPPAKPKHR